MKQLLSAEEVVEIIGEWYRDRHPESDHKALSVGLHTKKARDPKDVFYASLEFKE